MTVSTRTLISLGSLFLAMGCGSNAPDSKQNASECAVTTCMETCLCMTGDLAQCSAACAGKEGSAGSGNTVDPAGQMGCTTAPACGSCSNACDSCHCQFPTNPAECTAACAAPTGSGGASGQGGSATGSGGYPASNGGAAQGGSVSAGGGTGLPPGHDWTPASNLDANGKLIAPAAGEGFQISTPIFDLQPGQEVFKCFHVALPNTTEFPVGQWESQMSAGSHHFILYRNASDSTASGTLTNGGCTLGFGGPTWLYTSGSPHSELPMPDGVAMPVEANLKVVFDMHYINLGTDVIHAGVTLNMNKVKAATWERAQALVSFNLGIRIPANGTQTVGGDCTPGNGAKFFIMSTHTHRRGVEASITRVGGANEMLVHTTNWDSPTAGLWETPPYLTFAPGERFHYSCSYQNDRNAVTTVGTSADSNEMCMAITYFFPSSAGGSCN